MKSFEELLSQLDPQVVESARKKADEMTLEIKLAEIREKVEKTQVEMAATLGIKQPSLAAMEKSGKDIKLSSLKRYVEATGGKLSLNIELPDGSHMEMSV